jgi:acetyl-CoA carboxylase biotin carboxyl carrier protein
VEPEASASPKPEEPDFLVEEELIGIKSPMVGTFYRAAAPDLPPFVEVGDEVNEDTVLCIVEAMKLMNEIKAEMKGKVTGILIENGQHVEYGQPLFTIKPF